MARKPNYNFEKRLKEASKQQRKADKRQRKAEKKQEPVGADGVAAPTEQRPSTEGPAAG